jgi:O-antigen/teichoic acid export membrane protein
LIPILVLLASLINLLRFWANRKKLFGFNARVSIFNSFTIRFSNIGLGSLGYVSTAALVFISLFFQLIEAVYRIYSFLKSDIHTIRYQCSTKKIKEQFIRYKRFPLIDVWNGFMDTGSLLIVPILLSIYFSTTEVGLYSQSLNIVQLPLILIATTFGQVFFQRLSEAKYSGELKQVVSESFVFLLIISIPVFTVLFFWGTELFSFFLGERWVRAGQYASLLAPWCLLKMVYSPLSVTFIVTERQDVFLILTVTTLITRVLSIVIGGIYQSSYLSILLFGISGVITHSLGIFLVFRLSKVKPSDIAEAFKNNLFSILLKRISK